MNTMDPWGAPWRTSSYTNGQGACVEVAPVWRTSSYSNGQGSCVEVAPVGRASSYDNGQEDCVEVAPAWHKSSYSNGQAACVEAAISAPAVAVRDTKDRTGPVLVFGAGQWRDFLGGLRHGDPGRA